MTLLRPSSRYSCLTDGSFRFCGLMKRPLAFFGYAGDSKLAMATAREWRRAGSRKLVQVQPGRSIGKAYDRTLRCSIMHVC